MTWIKICGTTNLEDAQLSIAAGLRQQFKSVEIVGVFVNEAAGKIGEIVKQAGLTRVQLHGDEDVNFIRALREDFPRLRLYKALAATSRLKDKLIEFRGPHAPDCILVDSARMENGREKMGGTGRKSDWQSLAAVMSGGKGKWIIAGGLTPQNVAEAIQTLRPYGVDVVSGVERAPGKKDPAKLKAFVQAVREADRNHEKTP